MYKIVKKLQKKDDGQKRAIIFGLTVLSTLFVGGAWLLMLKGRLSGSEAFVTPTKLAQQEEKERVAIDVEGPFTSIKETAITSFAAIKSQFGEISKNFSQEKAVKQDFSGEEETEAFELPTNSQ